MGKWSKGEEKLREEDRCVQFSTNGGKAVFQTTMVFQVDHLSSALGD
jgi:hypothetical protein